MTEPAIEARGPVAESSRILGLDVARGFALLGILFVNAAFFGLPIAHTFNTAPVAEGVASTAVYWFTAVFCTGKFFPLFSLLFGAGLAILYERSRKAGRSFGWLFLRRLVVLAVIGTSHIALLWYGDILLLYSGLGLAMLLLGRASPKVLLIAAAILFAFGILTSLGFAALSTLDVGETASDMPVVPRSMPDGGSRIEQFFAVLTDWNTDEQYDSRATQLEFQIQSQGPFSDALLLRICMYLFTMVYFLGLTMWVVLPCFCIGAAMTKSGFLDPSGYLWRKRLMLLGFSVGLPLSILSALAGEQQDRFVSMAIYMAGSNIAGLLLALAYLSTILMLVERNSSSLLASWIGALGRMALTGYLMESLLMSAVMSHWGLGWFGSTTWSERAVLVVVVYCAILVFANVWMNNFRYGPLEWLWRSLTYLKWQSIRRVRTKPWPAL